MNETTHMRVAVIFHRIGPYHHARLRKAACAVPLTAVQGCSQDGIYPWKEVEHQGEYSLMTVFESGDCEDQAGAVVEQKLSACLGGLDPAVVVVPGWSTKLAISCLHWCLRERKPAVVVSDSTAWDSTRSAFKEKIKRRVIGSFAAALVAGTPHADYLAHLGMPGGRIFLGYDAVDNEYFARRAEEVRGQRSEVRGQCGLPERYFLASARFVEKKNLPRLIQAYARYRQMAMDRRTAGPQDHRTTDLGLPFSVLRLPPSVPWSLVLLGDGPLKPDLCRLISDLGLQDCVLLPGFKQYDELPVYYGLASAFVHASTVEQWGLVVNEAMASGLPVLVSNRCGCARDLVQEGVNGFTFDPYNVEQLAQLLLKLSTLNSQLSTLRSASREIISHWGLDRFAQGLQQAVEMAMSIPLPQANLLNRALLRLLLIRQGRQE